MGIFGKGKLIDFSVSAEDEELLTSATWTRLTELGIATEEMKRAMKENPEEGDKEMFTELAVAEAGYASRPWWQKIF